MGYEYIAALPRQMAGGADEVVHALLAQFPLRAEHPAGQAVAAFQWSGVPLEKGDWPYLSLHFAGREVLANFHGGLGVRGHEVLDALAAIVSTEVGEPVVFEEA